MRTGIRAGRGRVSRYAATILFLACLGFTGIVTAGLDTPEYPFRKLLEPAGEETARGELGSSEIDEEVFANVERGFVNLRVMDDSDSEVPVVVRRRATAREHGHEDSWGVVGLGAAIGVFFSFTAAGGYAIAGVHNTVGVSRCGA